MGMAPAQKAKKGRFGPGGTAPVLVVSAFPQQVTNGVASSDFTAEAQDAVDGDITSVIDWVSDLDAGSVGTGGAPTITLTAVGTHVITVSVTSPTGSQTVSQEIEVEVV